MVEWPEGPRLFKHLRDIERPFQLADLPGYFESLGFPPGPWTTRTMQVAPMRHRGEHLGHFFVGDKEDGDAFTPEDEEILVLFASQAAAAIANARTHREVERSRADLEALVETSPVGVVVLEAGSGRVASLNREAHRIVEGIHTPGSPPEQLLEVVTCRLPDGREVALADLPLAGLLEGAAPMRAEEVELSVPDGRSVRTLVNVTPIRSGDEGTLVSVRRDAAGPGAVRGARAPARGLPEAGEPRASRSARLDQGLGRDGARGHRPRVPGGDDRVLPADRRAGQPHAGAGRGPSGRGQHRGGDAHGGAGAHERGLARGPRPDHVRERREPASRARRISARPADGDGRQGAHRPSAEQPVRQRGAVRARDVADPGRGGARRRPRGDFGLRRGERDPAGGAPAPVPQARAPRGRHGARGSRSRRGSSRRTAAASEPRAGDRASARGSRSRCQPPPRLRRPARPARRVWPSPRAGAPACSWSTTIRSCCASSATRSARRAGPCWRRAIRGSWGA